MMWTKFSAHVRSAMVSDTGATAVEYALMVALIALAIVAAVTALGLVIPTWFQPVVDGLSGSA